jgi:hypothetical protein
VPEPVRAALPEGDADAQADADGDALVDAEAETLAVTLPVALAEGEEESADARRRSSVSKKRMFDGRFKRRAFECMENNKRREAGGWRDSPERRRRQAEDRGAS